LKQLLELSPVETFTPYFPALRDSIELPELPDKEAIFQKALENLPQVKKGKLAIEIAETEKRKSISSYYPTINLSGNLSSHYTVDDSDGFSTQMQDNFSPSAGVQLSVPIIDSKQTKTAVAQSDIAVQKPSLHYEQLEKTILMEVEKTYENCIAVYKRYWAAIAQLKAAHTSYDLAQQQHALGMLKPTELLVQRDLYNGALQELTQAKYSALLSYQLLIIYEGKHISFPEEFSLKE
jgi:outer membrane protein